MQFNEHDRTSKSNKSSLFSFFKRPSKGGYSAFSKDDVLQTPLQTILMRLIKNKLAVLGFAGFLAIFLLCFLGSALMPLNENYTELTHANLRPGTNYLDFPQEYA